MSTAPAFSPGPCSTRGPSRRQLLEMDSRALVAAVLGPHREDAELGDRRLAPERLHDPVVFVGFRPWRSSSAGSIVIVLPSRRRPPTRGSGPPTRTAPDRRRCRASARTRAPGAASCRRRCGARRYPRCSARRRSDSRLRWARRSRRRRTEDDPAIALERVEHVVGSEVVALAVIDRNAQDPAATPAAVNGVSTCSTRM